MFHSKAHANPIRTIESSSDVHQAGRSRWLGGAVLRDAQSTYGRHRMPRIVQQLLSRARGHGTVDQTPADSNYASDAEAASTSSPSVADAPDVVSLQGAAGEKVVSNLQLVVAGLAPVDKFGSAYFRAADGSLGVHLDEDSKVALARLLQETEQPE